jgi:hypothetical protein
LVKSRIVSASSALEKFVERVGDSEDRPRGNSHDDGEEQRFAGVLSIFYSPNAFGV